MEEAAVVVVAVVVLVVASVSFGGAAVLLKVSLSKFRKKVRTRSCKSGNVVVGCVVWISLRSVWINARIDMDWWVAFR